MKITLLLILVLVFSFFSTHLSETQSQSLDEAKSLSFQKIFPLVYKSFNLPRVIGISIEGAISSELVFSENMVLSVSSSAKYSEIGQYTQITLDVSNAISMIEVHANARISINYGVDSIDIYDKTLSFGYAIAERIGVTQNIVLDDHLLFSCTIPVLGVQVSIFVVPHIVYTPKLKGILNVQGAASSNPSNLEWSQNSLDAEVGFLNTEPISVFLETPEFIISNCKLMLGVYAIVVAAPTPTVDVELVNLGDYSIYIKNTELIRFEPNYHALYNELRSSYSALVDENNQLEQAYASMSATVSALEHKVNQQQKGESSIFYNIAMYSVILAVIGFALGLYALKKVL